MTPAAPDPSSLVDRYPQIGRQPQRWRSRRANALAAALLLAALIAIIVVGALA